MRFLDVRKTVHRSFFLTSSAALSQPCIWTAEHVMPSGLMLLFSRLSRPATDIARGCILNGRPVHCTVADTDTLPRPELPRIGDMSEYSR